MGLVTNIERQEDLEELEVLGGIPLLAVNIDEFVRALKIEHYPFALSAGEVCQ